MGAGQSQGCLSSPCLPFALSASPRRVVHDSSNAQDHGRAKS